MTRPPTGEGKEMRTVLAQGAIALMVCIGGYMFLVDPQAVKLAAARSEEESHASQARAAEALRDLAPQITAAAAKAKADAGRIEQSGRLARQEQELYAALTSVANTCRVRIDQMSPNKLAGTAKSGQPGQSNPETAEGSPNAAVGYMIDATATYGDLAAFLKAIRTELGYSVVKAVRLSPTMDAKYKYVHAVIQTEHFSFDASPIELGPPGATAEPGSH